MTKDELITKQQLEIEGLKVSIKQVERSLESVHAFLTNIGGPLNGSRKKYTGEQISDFYKILDEVEHALYVMPDLPED